MLSVFQKKNRRCTQRNCSQYYNPIYAAKNARGYALKKWLWAVAGTIVMLAAVCLCEIIRPAGADLPEQKVHFFVDELDQVNIWRNEKTGDVTVFPQGAVPFTRQ